MYLCLRICFARAVTSARNVVLPDSHIAYFLDLCWSLLKCHLLRSAFSDYFTQDSIPLLLLYFSSPLSSYVFLQSTSH